MKNIEEAKAILRLCNLGQSSYGTSEKWFSNLWHGYACILCGECCPECNMLSTLHFFFPELLDYHEVATKEEYLNSDLVSKLQKEYATEE